MIGLTVFAFQAQNLRVAQLWFLAGVLSVFLGVHVERRFGLQRKQTVGVLAPILLVGILVTAFAAIYSSGPSFISPQPRASGWKEPAPRSPSPMVVWLWWSSLPGGPDSLF